MSGSATDIVYWDTCIFYALFKGEDKHGAGVLEGIADEFDKFSSGKIKLVTSTVTIAEVAEGKFDDPGQFKQFRELKYDKYFEYVAPLVSVMELASELKNYYYNNPLGEKGEYKTLTLGDAVHLASAIRCNAGAFVTLDGNNKLKGSAIGLLRLTSPLAGKYEIQIRRPIALVKKEPEAIKPGPSQVTINFEAPPDQEMQQPIQEDAVESQESEQEIPVEPVQASSNPS